MSKGHAESEAKAVTVELGLRGEREEEKKKGRTGVRAVVSARVARLGTLQ